MSCCTFSSSLAIWSVPLRERREGRGGGGLQKLWAPPVSPFFFLCDGTGADLWWWCREGKERSRGGSFASYYPSLLAPYKTLYRTGDPSDARTVIPR